MASKPTVAKTPRKKPHKYTEEDLHRLGKELIEVCKEEDVFHLSEFAERHEKLDTWLYSLKDVNPTFNEYYQRAKRILGRKMQNMSLKKGFSNITYKAFLPKLLGCQEEFNEGYFNESYQKAKADALAKLEALRETQKDSGGALLAYVDEQLSKLSESSEDFKKSFEMKRKAHCKASAKNVAAYKRRKKAEAEAAAAAEAEAEAKKSEP